MTGGENKPEIRTERRGSSLWITIDREERRNAINKNVIAGIEAAVTAAQQDASVRRRRSQRRDRHLYLRS